MVRGSDGDLFLVMLLRLSCVTEEWVAPNFDVWGLPSETIYEILWLNHHWWYGNSDKYAERVWYLVNGTRFYMLFEIFLISENFFDLLHAGLDDLRDWTNNVQPHIPIYVAQRDFEVRIQNTF